MIFFLVIVTGITVYSFLLIGKTTTSTIVGGTEKITYTTYSIFETYKLQISLRNYLITNNEEDLNTFYANREEFQKNIEKTRTRTNTEEGNRLIENIVKAEEEYNQVADKMIALKKNNDTEGYIQTMKEEGTVAIKNLESVSRDIFFYQQDQMEESRNLLREQMQSATWVIMIIGFIAVMVALVLSYLISRQISRKLKIVSDSAQEIAEGNLSIEAINVKSKDEIGQLAVSFNHMLESLKVIIHDVNLTSEQVASSSEELMASSQETTAATNQVVHSIQEVSNTLETQGEHMDESSRAMGEITIGIQRIAESTSTAAEGILETTNHAKVGNEYIQKAVKQMDVIYKASSETDMVVKELEGKSNEIGKIIDVITSIADQTNLLALNAAIESARAGEHGKGFAVVADEVRKLAEQSRESASQIADIIHLIQMDTEKAAKSTKSGNDATKMGQQVVEETGKIFEQILTQIEKINVEAQELSAVSEELSASAEQVSASVDEVNLLSKSTIMNATEIASATEEQLATMEEVTSSATSLADLAEKLKQLVGRFKL